MDDILLQKVIHFLIFQIIEATQPDSVMLELCPSRINILQYDEETLLAEAQDINMDKIKRAIKQVSCAIVLAYQ